MNDHENLLGNPSLYLENEINKSDLIAKIDEGEQDLLIGDTIEVGIALKNLRNEFLGKK